MEVVTLLFRGSTAPTATSGVSTTASSLGGKPTNLEAVPLGALDVAMLSRERFEARGDAVVLTPSDFLEESGEATELTVGERPRDEFRKLLAVGEACESADSGIGDCANRRLLGSVKESSGHSRWRIRFFVAH